MSILNASSEGWKLKKKIKDHCVIYSLEIDKFKEVQKFYKTQPVNFLTLEKQNWKMKMWSTM